MSSFWLQGQSCGLEDTIIINPNATQTFQLQIADYFNNNLADPAQGVCGVELYFLHQFVDNLEIKLTSPDGDMVQLIGPNTDEQFAFTFFSRWNISFLPCAETAMPDSGYVAQWSNNQPANFASGYFYNGSYYPYIGCLEDFNSGSVNGTWTFTITNNPSQYSGAILFARLLFCDSRGVDCCFAKGGSLLQPDVLSCVGDTSLSLQLPPTISGLRPDTAEYTYTYLISRNDTLLNYTLTPDLTGYPAGTYEVCGLSYRRSQMDSLPVPDNALTIDSLRSNLDGFFARFCGEISDSCVSVTIVAPPPSTDLVISICDGASFSVGDSTFTESGVYSVVLDNYAGCDSLVNLDLTVVPDQTTTLMDTICRGDSVVVGTTAYHDSGSYTNMLFTQGLGCDSTVILNLTVLEPVVENLAATICQGESFLAGGNAYTLPGSYTIPLMATSGCDSVLELSLTVLQVSANIAAPADITCLNNGVTLDASLSSPAGFISFNWTDLAGNMLNAGPTLFVDTAGTYALEVTLVQSGAQCFAYDTVSVSDIRMYPTADAGMSDTIVCVPSQVSIGGPNSSMGATFSYIWQTIGGSFSGPVNTPTTTADAAGLYLLIVENTLTGCRDSSTVEIIPNNIPPFAEAGTGFVLDCEVVQGTLDGSASEQGASLTYSWTGPCILSPADAQQITVDCPGLYTLEVRNTITGCVATDTVRVLRSTAQPNAVIAPPLVLNCYNPTVTLDGSASSPSDSIDYQWFGTGLDDTDTLATIVVTEPGLYTLVTNNPFTQCADTATVTVLRNVIYPIAEAGQDTSINCNRNTVILGGAGTSSGPDIVYEWFSDEGMIIGADNGATIEAGADGVYVLFVTDTLNGCADTSFVSVIADLERPFANAGMDITIDCASDFATLTGVVSGDNPIAFSWSGDCILSPADMLSITVHCAGDYILTALDTINGCMRSDTVSIFLSPFAVQAFVTDTTYISCETGTATINTTGTTSGFYRWFWNGELTTITGLNPVVTEAGTYLLVVSNLDESCTDSATAVVILDCIPQAIVATPDTINCIREIVQLDASASSAGAQFSYFWVEPAAGCLVDGQGTTMPRVRCEGSYDLIVTNTVVQTSDTVTVFVALDTLRPIADASLPDTITCEFREVLLDAGNSSSGSEYAYVWTSVSNNDTLSQTPVALADLPGTYLLEVYDTRNGCRAVDFVQVFQKDVIPRIIFPNTIFPCLQDSTRLASFVDPPDGSFSYEWSGAGILGNTDSASVSINGPGIYILTVTELIGNCFTIDTAIVTEQNCVPCLSLMEPASLTCTNGTAVLEVEFCEPCIGCTLQWSTTSPGIILSDDTTLTPTVGAAGTYTLIATDTLGFQSSLNVIVTGATDPIADAGPDRFLTCDSLRVTLGSFNTPEGADFSYQWSAASIGNPIPLDTRFTEVDAEDTYFLEVLNTHTGCFARDTVVVGRNIDTPVADAGTADAITCNQSLVVLDGTGSTFGNNISYLWTNGSATCIQGPMTLNPIVSCAGTYYLTVRNTTSGCTAMDSVIVDAEGMPPTLLPIADTSLNCINTQISLLGNAPDLTGYSVEWCAVNANGSVIAGTCQNNLELIINQAGRYRFSLQNDTTGCRATTIVTVSDNSQLPIIEAGSSATLFCNQDSMVLQGSAPANLQYEWSAWNGSAITNANTLTPTIYSPDTFVLRVTNVLTNCVSMDTVVILQDLNAPSTDAGEPDTLNCMKLMTNLNGQGTTASGNIVWQWSTDDGNIVSGSGTQTPLVDRGGAYFLRITDPVNGCVAIDTVVIAEQKQPPMIDLAGFPDLQLTCREDTITFDATNSTSAIGAPLSYAWTVVALGNLIGDPSMATVQADQVGIYQLIISDTQNSCRDTLRFSLGANVTTPTAVVAEPLPLGCNSLETTLNATGSSTGVNLIYEWRDPSGILLPETGATIQVSLPGTYTFSVIDTTNGCSASLPVPVIEDTTLPTAIIEADGLLDCETQEILLDGKNSSAGSRYAYFWSTDTGTLLSPADAVSVLAGSEGMYFLTVRDLINGCEATDTLLVEAVANFISGAAISVLPASCNSVNGGTIIVESVTGGTGPFVFALNSTIFTTTQNFRFLLPGDYTLQIQDANGCEWDTTIVMPQPLPPVVDLGPDITINLGDSIQLEALVNGPYESLRWLPAEAFSDPTQPVQRVSPSETIAYTVVVRDANGCEGSDVVLITIVKTTPVFIPNAFSPNGDGQNDVLVIFAGDGVRSILTFNIFDRWGNLVFGRQNFQPNDPTLGWDGNFENRPMNSAIYAFFAEVEMNDGSTVMLEGDVVLMR